jgi:N-acetylglucosaminyldiphosphoundecaprenol N-acetyl-beta-D-mannosaminyltransferase
VHLGHVPLERVRLPEVLGSIEALVVSGLGGHVLAPGVAQVVLAEEDTGLREAFATAALSLAGGPELVRAARWIGQSLPEELAGAEWVPPLARRARERSWRIFVVAEEPGVAEWSAGFLRDRYGVLAVGATSPKLSVDAPGPEVDRLLERISLTRPHLVLVSMSTPRQERFCQYAGTRLQPAVVIGLGRAMESLVDTERPRPRRRAGRGWLDGCRRLLTEPVRRLHRKLSFLRIVLRSRRPQRLALPVGAGA